MKPVRIIIFLVIAFVAIALVVGVFYESLLKKAITSVGPAVLKVPVELESIEFNPVAGHAKIQTLTIHNPEGFESPYALQIKDFGLDLSTGSLMSDTIHIRDIELSGVTLISEGLRSDNQRAIINNLSKGGSGKKKPSEKPETETKSKEPGKKLIIDHFSFTDSKLIIIVDGEEITKVDFPEIELQQIGKKGSAVTATEAITQIYTAIASETTKVLTVNKEVIEALANAKLKKLGIDNIDALKHPEKILKDPKAIGNILNNILNSDE